MSSVDATILAGLPTKMRLTTSMPQVLVVLLLIFFHQIGVTRSIVIDSPETALHVARKAAIVIIDKSEAVHAEGRECGYHYTASVVRVVKGKNSAKKMTFGFRGGLEPGQKYTIYFHSSGDTGRLREYMAGNTESEGEVDGFLSACKGAIGQQYWFFAVPIQ